MRRPGSSPTSTTGDDRDVLTAPAPRRALPGAARGQAGRPGGPGGPARPGRGPAAGAARAHAGYLIKVTAQQDGTFTVTNTRNGFSKTYRPRP